MAVLRMADPNAAIGFAASIMVQGMGVAASALVGKVACDRLQKKEAKLKAPTASDFGPETVKAHLSWGIDAVTAVTALVGPMAAFVLLVPTMGVQISTLLNLVAVFVSFVLFVAVMLKDDPVTWVSNYKIKRLVSPVNLVGMGAYLTLGLLAWLLAKTPT